MSLNDRQRQELAANMKAERKKRGWSQERLAQEAFISTNTAHNMERGKPAMQSSVDKVEDAFGGLSLYA